MIKKNILTLFLVLLATFFPVYAEAANDSFVLTIDAGHGGKDPGALGKKSKEKEINLAVAALAGDYIARENPNVKVVYTRKKDVFLSLKERTKIANRANANLFISIHCNASTSHSTNGAEVYVLGLRRTRENLEISKRENNVTLLEDNYKENYRGYDPKSPEFSIMYEYLQNKYIDESLRFASKVQDELATTAKRKSNGVKQAGFWVLVGASMPCILIEMDYISNSKTEEFISSKSGQEKIARSIANAFTEFKKGYDSKKQNISYRNNDDISKTDPEELNPPKDTLPQKDKPKANIKEGTIYKVQIFVAAHKLNKNSRLLKGYKANFYIEDGLYKYTYGESSDLREISRIRKSLLKDFKDAFIIKFENGTKVPINKK